MDAVTPLADQIGRVAELDLQQLADTTHEALTIPDEWVAEYAEFQSGGWLTLSLYNDTGDPRDVAIRDCEAQETELLRRMPATRELLHSLDLRYMWARVARLRPNSFLWEHRDYGELADRERHRLHIPLQTNASAALVAGGAWIHLRAGNIWCLAPENPHGACNLTGPDRLHLIMDCYGDEVFRRLAGRTELTEGDVIRLPAAEPADLADGIDRAALLAELGYQPAAERSLLRLFYRYSLAEGQVYDLIAGMYQRLGDDVRASSWRDKRKAMLGAESWPS